MADARRAHHRSRQWNAVANQRPLPRGHLGAECQQATQAGRTLQPAPKQQGRERKRLTSVGHPEHLSALDEVVDGSIHLCKGPWSASGPQPSSYPACKLCHCPPTQGSRQAGQPHTVEAAPAQAHAATHFRLYIPSIWWVKAADSSRGTVELAPGVSGQRDGLRDYHSSEETDQSGREGFGDPSQIVQQKAIVNSRNRT